MSKPEGSDQGRQHVADVFPALSNVNRFVMLLTPLEISKASPPDFWFCLTAQPKREHIAAACIGHLSGVTALCPRIRYKKSTSRGPVHFTEPMFPGYLFAKLDYFSLHRQVRLRPGIRDFVQFGDRFAALPDAFICELKSRLGAEGIVDVSNELKPGQSVEIRNGPFQGFEALVNRLIVAGNRVEILIHWMGRNLFAEAVASDLLPLSCGFEGTSGILTEH